MQSKRNIGIMGTEKRRKNEGERAKMLENTEIVRERKLTFKPITKENLVLFAIPKLYRKYQSLKDELCKKKYIIHLLFSLHGNKRIV